MRVHWGLPSLLSLPHHERELWALVLRRLCTGPTALASGVSSECQSPSTRTQSPHNFVLS